ncbi:AraC family transcriptional regulator [Alsobacter sp. R-9]
MERGLPHSVGRPVAYHRAGGIAGVAALIRDLGHDPAALGGSLGLDLDSLTTETRIPFPTVVELLERAAVATGCPHFGLLLGSRTRPEAHGIIYRLARHAPTLRQALLDHITWQLGYSSGGILYLNRVGQDYAFGYGIYDRQSYGSAQVYDFVAALFCTFLRELAGGRVEPLEVLLCRRPPDDIRPYQQILKVPVRFNENQACMVLAGHALDTPLPAADPDQRIAIVREVEALHAPIDRDFPMRLRRIVRPMLLEGAPSMVDAARALGIPVRTLRRRLAVSSQTFETIRDEVRYTLARDLLMLTDLPVSDVAEALAFATHSAFTNAFQRWSGKTPSAWRAHSAGAGRTEARGGATAPIAERADSVGPPAIASTG